MNDDMKDIEVFTQKYEVQVLHCYKSLRFNVQTMV